MKMFRGPRAAEGKHVRQAESPIVVIGASAGGIQALLELIAELPAAYCAPVFVVHG